MTSRRLEGCRAQISCFVGEDGRFGEQLVQEWILGGRLIEPLEERIPGTPVNDEHATIGQHIMSMRQCRTDRERGEVDAFGVSGGADDGILVGGEPDSATLRFGSHDQTLCRIPVGCGRHGAALIGSSRPH